MLQIQRILLIRTGKMSYECTNNMFLRDTFHLLISKNYLFDSSVFLEEARGPSRRGTHSRTGTGPFSVTTSLQRSSPMASSQSIYNVSNGNADSSSKSLS